MQNLLTARTVSGSAIGAGLGFLFGGPAGAAIGALLGGGVAHSSSDAQKGVMTPKRRLIFERAMERVKDPAQLESLAAAFHGEGFPGEASLLRKRAKLRSLDPGTKEKRRVAFRKAMACDNPDVILQIALAFQNEGAFDAAQTLRDHAEAVQAAHAAGKTCKPMVGGSVEQFADKLSKAIHHFGPRSPQAASAAKNLILARGKQPTDDLVKNVLDIAAKALEVEAPKAKGPPSKPITIDTDGAKRPASPDEEEADAAADANAPVVAAGQEEEPVLGATPRPIEPEQPAASAAVPPPAPDAAPDAAGAAG